MSFYKLRIPAIVLAAFASVNAAKIITPVYPTQDVIVADFDAADYGADPKGIADATAAIQNAVNACYASGGGTVWLPAGTYKITSTIYVKPFVSLRGDWRDPDSSGSTYGTVISAQVKSGTTGPVVFQIGGSAGVLGVTVYYPDQSAVTPVSYNYTFFISAEWASGQQGLRMSHSIINCTMLNSYRGIGKLTGTTTNPPLECTIISNVKGTVLYRGVVANNASDVGSWSHIYFNNSYWANAGAAYNAPNLTALNACTRANGIAFTLAAMEWDQFHDIQCSSYDIGINIIMGDRIQFSGEFIYSKITDTRIAVKADLMDIRWGVSFLRCTLSGSTAAVQNNVPGADVWLTDCLLSGAATGSVITQAPGTTPAAYPEYPFVIKGSRTVLYDVTKAPYNAPRAAAGTAIPAADATGAIQSALNDAGSQGGGVVYMPAGWYRIATHLSVPANVELRGCLAIPQLDQDSLSLGTTLLGYEGKNTATPGTGTAMITLSGNKAGINGLRIFYPENNPVDTVKPYPFSIRGSGSELYVVNVGLIGVWNGIDFAGGRCDNHLVRNVFGTLYNLGIAAGSSSHGWIENCQTNPAKVIRCNYGIPGWVNRDQNYTLINDLITKVNLKHIVINGCADENLLNCFSYGANIALWVQSGKATSFNLGTDNAGDYLVRVDCGSGPVKVMNAMRYNGTTLTGSATIYNLMVLNSDKNPAVTGPKITSTPPLVATAGVPYRYAITTTGSAPALHLSDNPSWMVLNGSVLSGIPPNSGRFGPITITAVNSLCPVATQVFTINPSAVVSPRAAIMPAPGSDKSAGMIYSVTGRKISVPENARIDKPGVYIIMKKGGTAVRRVVLEQMFY